MGLPQRVVDGVSAGCAPPSGSAGRRVTGMKGLASVWYPRAVPRTEFLQGGLFFLAEDVAVISLRLRFYDDLDYGLLFLTNAISVLQFLSAGKETLLQQALQHIR